MVRLLSEDDFSPEAETDGDTLRIKLVNCPFRTVALQNSAVCAFDQRLISTMLDVDVERQGSIHEGDSCCMYEARLSPGDKQPLSTSGTA